MSRRDHHPPCPGGCGELADECMTPGCGRPLGSMRLEPGIGSTRATGVRVDEHGRLHNHARRSRPEATS